MPFFIISYIAKFRNSSASFTDTGTSLSISSGAGLCRSTNLRPDSLANVVIRTGRLRTILKKFTWASCDQSSSPIGQIPANEQRMARDGIRCRFLGKHRRQETCNVKGSETVATHKIFKMEKQVQTLLLCNRNKLNWCHTPGITMDPI